LEVVALVVFVAVLLRTALLAIQQHIARDREVPEDHGVDEQQHGEVKHQARDNPRPTVHLSSVLHLAFSRSRYLSSCGGQVQEPLEEHDHNMEHDRDSQFARELVVAE
jgi:hypothetical protein